MRRHGQQPPLPSAASPHNATLPQPTPCARCYKCKALLPEAMRLAEAYPHTRWLLLDWDQHEALARGLGVPGALPSVLMYKDGGWVANMQVTLARIKMLK